MKPKDKVVTYEMKYQMLGLLVGTVIHVCVNQKEKRRVTSEDFFSFIQSVQNEEMDTFDTWVWKTTDTGRAVSCVVSKEDVVLYTAVYIRKEENVYEEHSYRPYIASTYWNELEDELFKKTIELIKKRNHTYAKEKELNEQKEKPYVFELTKVLRVIQKRGE